MRLLFKGGTVVTGKGPRRADILVEGEKILDVCRDIPAIGAQVVDVTGMLLFPGFIDAHTHFDLDVCNTTTADDFASGSRAALRGGTTTIIDFACPNKGETLHDGLRLWHEKADGKCACDYGFHMTIDDWNETIEREIDDMYAEGISSFKMYMTYPAMMIGDEAMYKALKKLKEKGGICGVHCENAGVIDALIAEKKAAGENGVHCHPETRPDIMEAEAVGRLLRIAEQVDIPVVIVHTTNIEALDEIANARWRARRSLWRRAPSIWYWMTACIITRTGCRQPNTSARLLFGNRLTVRPCGGPSAGVRCRPCPPTIAASPRSRSWRAATISPLFPAASPAWRPAAS